MAVGETVATIIESGTMLLRLGAGVLSKYRKGEINKTEFDAYLAEGRTHSDAAFDEALAEGIARLSEDED